MGSPGFLTTSGVHPRFRSSQTWIWVAAAAAAAIGGAVVTRVPIAYVWAFLALAVVVSVFLWRSQEPMVPFLLLVAAMQGGVLLQLPLGDAPIATMMPLLGGWTLVAVLVGRERNHLGLPASRRGKLLPYALAAMATVVALTAAAQNWRPEGRLLGSSELLTLVQLGVLVWLAAFVLSSPKRVLWVAYAATATGVAVSLVAIADRFGLITLGTEMVYREGYTRVSGLLSDPNFFSFQLLVSLAFAAHIALAAKTTFGRIMVWSSFATILAGIVCSYSAGAVVGVAAVLIAVVLLQFRVSVKRAVIALVVIAAVTGVVAATAPPGYTETVTSKYSGITSSSFENLGTKRGAAWQAALSEVVSNPVLGVGLSTQNLQTAIADYYTLERTDRKAAHNMYLGIAVGAGAFGLAAFVMILASCFSILWFAYVKATGERQSETTVAVACLLTALLVVATQGLQLDLQFDKYLWLLIGASLAVRHWSLDSRQGSLVSSRDGC